VRKPRRNPPERKAFGTVGAPKGEIPYYRLAWLNLMRERERGKRVSRERTVSGAERGSALIDRESEF